MWRFINFYNKLVQLAINSNKLCKQNYYELMDLFLIKILQKCIVKFDIVIKINIQFINKICFMYKLEWLTHLIKYSIIRVWYFWLFEKQICQIQLRYCKKNQYIICGELHQKLLILIFQQQVFYSKPDFHKNPII